MICLLIAAPLKMFNKFLRLPFGKGKLNASTQTLHNHIRRLTQLDKQKKHQIGRCFLIIVMAGLRGILGILSFILGVDTKTNYLSLFLKST
ncbi:hypothetical protein CXF95_05820 [Paraglaciecola sp. MB-3u-78]|nr:hypothetical protein CXF95_05820 [Paraglaciecola sp. MB-3u-78]